MKPIDERSDLTFLEALRCVQYRVPQLGEMREASYAVALGLRYGLVGTSAAHHLMLAHDYQDRSAVVDLIRSWPLMVDDHLRMDLAPKLPVRPTDDLFERVSQLAHQPLRHYLSLWSQGIPLERSLTVITERFITEHEASMRKPWTWWRPKTGLSDFRIEAQSSLLYALHFFERREAGLEEVPAIALLGE